MEESIWNFSRASKVVNVFKHVNDCNIIRSRGGATGGRGRVGWEYGWGGGVGTSLPGHPRNCVL